MSSGWPQRFRLRPARQGLGDGVQIGDAALGIGRDDGVADAAQRDPQQLAAARSPGACAKRIASPNPMMSETGEEVRGRARRASDVEGTEAASRLDEQVVAGEIAEDGDDDRRRRAAHPHGRGDGAEQRDER